MFSGPDREKWPKMESTYSFALVQYKHMMTEPQLNPLVDILGGAFYDFLGSDEEQYMDAMKLQFKKLTDGADVPDVIRERPNKGNPQG